MLFVLAQMFFLIACGVLWRYYAPQHIPISSHRRALTDLVFYILLPAMVLNVIWQSELDSSSVQISFLATFGLITGITLMWLVSRVLKTTKTQTGALLLAATFPNATYLGLPVLDQVLGPWSNSTVLQYDMFSCTPILLSLGIVLAKYYGRRRVELHLLIELLKVPPLLAVILAIALNFSGIEQHATIHYGLSILADGVVPLMLIALGMSIRWDTLKLKFLPILLPVVLISLFIVPASVYVMGNLIGLADQKAMATVLIAAMPTMVFGIVICERYQLDSELYAAAVTLTTLCSLISLPVWFELLAI